MTRPPDHQIYVDHVNPAFVELLEALDYGRSFVRARGTRLWDADGREYLDFLAGYGVHNIGHNHPHLIEALRNALAAEAPSMLNVDAPACQAALAERLSALTHTDLCRAFFANSGAEAVEMAVKTARAATGRAPVVACGGAYHGLTTGAMALTDAPAWRRRFAPLLGPVEWTPFGDVAVLRRVCAEVRPAAVLAEPIQGEGGICVPAPDFLAEAAAVCRAAGALLIVDEIQTGLGRAGTLFATPFGHVVPDILLLGKALSGGAIPIAVGLVKKHPFDRAFGSPDRCNLNASTFAGGHLACAAAMATLDIVIEERLAGRAAATGALLMDELRRVAARHACLREVRGAGLMIGIELAPPAGLAMRLVPEWAREGLQANVLCALLLRDHGIVAQPCSLRQNVLRAEPPLIASEEEARRFAAALDQVLAACPSPAAALRMAARRRLTGGAL